MEDYLNNLNNNSIYKNDYKLADSYNITDWDPSTITEDITGGLITICAPSGSGKSVLLKHILSEIHKKFENIYLMCPTAKLQDIYDFMPKHNIMDTFNEEFLQRIWDAQVRDKSNKQLIIMDDIIDLPEFKKSKKLDEMAHGFRHLNGYVILLSQDFNSIRPTLRKNARIAISFELPSKKEREKFTESYMSLENNHIGEILYKKLTGVKYQCVVCLNYMVGCPLDTKVKKFIANPKTKLKIQDKRSKKFKMNDEYDAFSTFGLTNLNLEEPIGKCGTYNPYDF